MVHFVSEDVIIYYLRGIKNLQTEWIENKPAISVITLGELFYGTKKSSKQQKRLLEVENFIQDFDIEVIEVDSEIIKIYSQEKIALEKLGTKLDDFDLLIGSTAKSKDLTLVTNNKRHFERMSGLKLA